jgi:ribosome-binding protein aMBF1 (putative translation factor)
MAKYSTGGGDSGAGGSCELCGASETSLRTVNVAGAELEVCPECAEHDDAATSTDGDRDRERRERAAQNTARVYDASRNDPSHWESGTDYEEDRLPYLADGYGDRFTEARQAAGLQLDDLAAELGLEESDLLAIEQGRAAQAGVGGSVVAALEDHLDVELSETQ